MTAQQQAEDAFRAAVERHRAGDLDGALAGYRQTLALVPNAPNVHGMLGTCLMDRGERAAAETHFREAVRLAPGDASHRRNLAMWLLDAGREEEAIEALKRALALAPDEALLRTTLGGLLARADRLDEAEAQFRRVLRQAPDDGAALHGLGLLLRDGGELQEAETLLRRVAEAPDPPAAIFPDFASLLRQTGREEEALALLDAGAARYPDDGPILTMRALIRLARGDLTGGWADYVDGFSRREDRAADCSLDPVPDTLSGKRVRVDRDQGVGDEIFFMRFVVMLAARGAAVDYRGDPRLSAMFERMKILSDCGPVGTQAAPADLAYCAADLPHLLAANGAPETPPSIELTPLPDRVDAIRTRLAAAGPGPYIGITWRAGVQQRDRLSKIVPQDAIATALRGIDATPVALQRLPATGEIEALGREMGRTVHDFTDLNDDIEAMLACVGLIDDYVCVSNTNVHLRTASGRPSRILVPHPPEFRWMSAGDTSPWFPDCSLYREHYRDGWTEAAENLANDLISAYRPAGHE